MSDKEKVTATGSYQRHLTRCPEVNLKNRITRVEIHTSGGGGAYTTSTTGSIGGSDMTEHTCAALQDEWQQVDIEGLKKRLRCLGWINSIDDCRFIEFLNDQGYLKQGNELPLPPKDLEK